MKGMYSTKNSGEKNLLFEAGVSGCVCVFDALWAAIVDVSVIEGGTTDMDVNSKCY